MHDVNVDVGGVGVRASSVHEPVHMDGISAMPATCVVRLVGVERRMVSSQSHLHV